jgi:hypothetical protein
MRRILLAAGVAMCLCGAVVAVRPANAEIDMAQYGRDLRELKDLADEISRPVDANSLSFVQYDTWYGKFKEKAEAFEKTYMAEMRQRESFVQARSALYELSSARASFKQAEDAKKQYQDFITANDIGYAHQWRATAEKKRQAAISSAGKGIVCFLEACRLYEAGK